MWASFKTLQRMQQHGGYSNNHWSKLCDILTLESLFVTATFKGLWDVSFKTVKAFKGYFGLYESSFHFYRRDDQVDTVYGKKL